MTEHKINHLLDVDCRRLSGSVAELGENAGEITWRNSMEMGKRFPVVTADQIDELRDYYADFGAWEREEIDAWTFEEMNGMVTQEAAAEKRELDRFETTADYHEAAERGTVSGNIYFDDEGNMFIQLSH